MKKLEIILLGLFLVGISFIFLHYPGGTIISVLAVGSLSIIYAYLGFAFFNGIGLRQIGKKGSYSGLSKSMIITSVLLGIGVSILIIGLLFQLMDWPNSYILLIAGFSISILGIMLSFSTYKSSTFPIRRIAFLRLLVFGILTFFLIYFNLEKRLEMHFNDHPEFIEAAKAAHKNPQNQELRDKADEERRKMNEGQ